MKKIKKIITLSLAGLIVLIIGANWQALGQARAWVEEVPAAMQEFTTADGIMRYVDQGTGPAILLVHGIPTSSHMYRDLITELSATGYRVIAPDMIGFGHSDKPTDQSAYAFDLQSSRLLDLMNHLNITSWTQVAHDMGGIVTWEMLKADASKIDNLVILDTIGAEFTPPVPITKSGPLASIYKLIGTPIGAKLFLQSSLTSGGVSGLSKSEKISYWAPFVGHSDSLEHFFTSFDEIFANLPEYYAAMNSYAGEVHILWGQNDPFLDSEIHAKKIAEEFTLDNSNFSVIPAKHFLPETNVADIAKVVETIFQ